MLNVNTTSFGSDLSTIVSITIFTSNFVKNKISEVLKNFEIIMIAAIIAAIIGITLNRGNFNFAATLLAVPTFSLLLREDYILNKNIRNIINRFNLIILLIYFAFILLTKSSLLILISTVFLFCYCFFKYFPSSIIINIKILSILYPLFFVNLNRINFAHIDIFSKGFIHFRTGWDLKNDIRYLIDIGIIKEFFRSNAYFWNGFLILLIKVHFFIPYKIKKLLEI